MVSTIGFLMMLWSAYSHAGTRDIQGWHYVVSGHIDGVKGRYVYLRTGYGPSYASQDSVFSQTGEFRFEGDRVHSCWASLGVQGEKRACFFILEQGDISIEGDVSDVFKAIVKGSEENRAHMEYRSRSQLLEERNKTINVEMRRARTSGDSASYKKLADEFHRLGGEFFETLVPNFISTHNSMFVALHVCRTTTMGPYGADLRRKFLGLIDSSLREHPDYLEMVRGLSLKAAVGVGKEAPNFVQPDSSGNVINLRSFRGKYVLVDFWASWCAPCRSESPALVKAYRRFRDKGFEIVSVSLDEDRSRWLKAVAQDHYTWTNLSDLRAWNNAAATLYGVSAIPANFLIDPKGTIIDRDLRGSNLENALLNAIGQ